MIIPIGGLVRFHKGIIMNKLYLMSPAITTCLGDGIRQNFTALLAEKSPLKQTNHVFSQHQIQAKPYYLGEVAIPLRAFPDHLDPIHYSRNNQLLWHSLQQIESQIQQAITQFGKQRIAVVMGSSTTGADENIPVFQSFVHNQNWQEKDFNQQQCLFSAPADFIAAVYDLQGLTYGISTACTSGARALISAARLLQADLCDAVICGGVDTLSLLTVSGFHSLSVLSEQQTNPFSANRQGINIGEGSAVFLMSKTPLLIDDQDDYVELLGYGSSSDAHHMSSPDPTGNGAISAFQHALRKAELNADQVGWINLHGTGTNHNDQMEALAVVNVFGEQLPCTSTKPYTGHTLGAAGAVEAAILWATISRKINPNGVLPAQLWDNQPDPTMANIYLTDKNSHWQKEKRIGASSSFAFGGNNAVLILGECHD